MHPSVMIFATERVEEFGLAGRSTLEVGSYNVNGSVRDLFHGAYIGVDMRPGPGVDREAVASDLPFADEAFAVVVSTEMLEHDRRPWLSVREMARVLQPGGYLLLTCRGYDNRGCFPVHDYPDDLWRFSVGAVTELFGDAGLEVVEAFDDPEAPGVLAVGRKP